MVGKIWLYNCLFFSLLLTSQSLAVAPDRVTAIINVGTKPNGIAITPDGRYVYVANNNDDNIPGDHTVSVIDTATNIPDVLITDASFDQPYTITIKDVGNAAGKAYVTNSNGTTVTIIDLSDNSIMGTITGFDGPSGFAITPDGSTAYVNNYGSPTGVMSGNGNTISVVDLGTNMIIHTITLNMLPDPPAAPAALAVTNNGEFVYVANYVDGETGTGTVSVIRTSNYTVMPTITGFSGPFNIIMTPDGNYAYVANFGSNNFEPVGTTVSVIDLNTNTISDTIEVGIQPAGLAITPDGKYVYVSNYYTLYLGPMFTNLHAFQGTVNIIDTSDNSVLSTVIDVGSAPAGIAISPDGDYAYVTNYLSNNVYVIGLPLFTVTIQGSRTRNVFLTEIDLINKITWSVAGEQLPISYSIYRDAQLNDLVATVPATEPLVFFDHNRNPNITYTYYIIGTNAAGISSYPVSVTVTATVTQNCYV